MTDPRDDWDLLQDYVRTGSHTAFQPLLKRHIGLVYSAARRRTGRADLAEDVAQAVFMILAAKAKTIRRGTPLSVWLFSTTRYASANAIKMKQRREYHERQAAAQRQAVVEDRNTQSSQNETLLPLLDSAIDHLGQRDRTAVLLRFFQGRSYEEVGDVLGSSAHAAEVRTSRAVEKLRGFFAIHSSAASSSSITSTLAARTTDTAPPAVAGVVIAAALGHSAIGHAPVLAAATTKSMSGFSGPLLAVAAILLITLTTGGTVLFIVVDGASRQSIAPASISQSSASTAQIAAALPIPPNIDAAALVRKVRQDESWVEHVHSFQLILTDDWVRPQRALDARRVGSGRGPTANLTNSATLLFPKPHEQGSVELDFDQHHLFQQKLSDGEEPEDVRFWDGEKAFDHERYVSGQESYAFDNSPKMVANFFLDELPWLRAAWHPYWWAVPQDPFLMSEIFGDVDDYHLAGRRNFRGHDCFVLEAPWPRRIFYVAVTDKRLYGIDQRIFPSTPQFLSKSTRLSIRLAADLGHPEITSDHQFDEWFRSLPVLRRNKFMHQLYDRYWPLARPFANQWYEDYKDLAPGRSIPMTMGYDVWDESGSYIQLSRTLKVISVSVDQPIPQSRFEMDMKEGVKVCDWGHKPALIYNFKKNPTQAEWNDVLEGAQGRERTIALRRNSAARGHPANTSLTNSTRPSIVSP